MKAIEEYVRSIPDFPEPGIIFRDVTSILQDAEGLHLAIDLMQEKLKDVEFDVVVGPESRGFIFGVPIAYNLHKPFIPIRKKGKLPCETVSVEYELEYGTATIEMHKDAIKPGQRVVIIDDLIATGGTNEAMVKLIEGLGGKVVKTVFLMELAGLKGRERLEGYDVYELGEDNLKYGMYLFTDLFWDKIKKDRKIKKAIYLDEIWRLIGVTSNKEVASFIYKIFKTIRKYGGSSVAITQDISDLFSLNEGTYGKSILNNSSIKTFFSLEEENIKVLEKYTNLSEKEKIEIKSLKRGECLMFVGNEHILTKIESADFEKKIIV